MSIEDKIEALTAAINRLAENVACAGVAICSANAAVNPVAPTTDAPVETAPAVAPAADTDATPELVSTELSAFVKARPPGVGRAEALAILRPFGIARLGEAKTEQYAGILAALRAAA